MKKTIAILLVAILAVSSVFAAFSGEASLGFGGNFDDGTYGFIDSATKIKFDIDLATASAEQIADGDVYASIKATFGLKLTTGEESKATGDHYWDIWDAYTMANVAGLGIIADITEAKVAGENWYVSILGVPDAPNFAESAIDTYTVKDGWDKYGMSRADYDKAYNYGIPFEKATGVEVSVFDYVFGLGLVGDYNDDDAWKFEDYLDLALYAKTPEYNFSGLNLQFGAVYSYAGDPVEASEKNALGVSAKVGFANDSLSASVATDMGFDLTKDKFEDVFGADVAANFTWNFLTVDGYYATKAQSGESPIVLPSVDDPTYDEELKKFWNDPTKTEKSYKEDYLSAQVKFDLNAFDVPVALTVAAKDLIATQDLSLKAEVTAIENLTISANGGYTLDADGRTATGAVIYDDHDWVGKWKLGADVEYDFGFATVAAGMSVEQKLDDAKNDLSHCRNAETCISADSSPVKVFVIPTDEELVITEDAYALMNGTYDVHTNFHYTFESPDYVNKARAEGLKGNLKKTPELERIIAIPPAKASCSVKGC